MWFTAIILAAEENGGSGGSNWFGPIIMIVLFGAIFYFLLWRPQQKRMRSQMEMMESIRVGDEVVTQGGVYGYVTELEDDTLLLEISEGVEIRVAKSSIYRNLSSAERGSAEKEKEAKGGPESGEEAEAIEEEKSRKGSAKENGD